MCLCLNRDLFDLFPCRPFLQTVERAHELERCETSSALFVFWVLVSDIWEWAIGQTDPISLFWPSLSVVSLPFACILLNYPLEGSRTHSLWTGKPCAQWQLPLLLLRKIDDWRFKEFISQLIYYLFMFCFWLLVEDSICHFSGLHFGLW